MEAERKSLRNKLAPRLKGARLVGNIDHDQSWIALGQLLRFRSHYIFRPLISERCTYDNLAVRLIRANNRFRSRHPRSILPERRGNDDRRVTRLDDHASDIVDVHSFNVSTVASFGCPREHGLDLDISWLPPEDQLQQEFLHARDDSISYLVQERLHASTCD